MKRSVARSHTTTLFNPLLPEFRADPYATFHRLRAEAPVAWSSAPMLGFWGFWCVSRYPYCISSQRVGEILPPSHP